MTKQNIAPEEVDRLRIMALSLIKQIEKPETKLAWRKIFTESGRLNEELADLLFKLGEMHCATRECGKAIDALARASERSV